MAPQQLRKITRLLAAGAALTGLATLAACSGTAGGEVNADYGFTIAEQDASSPITIWVDAAREPLAKAFEEANPDVPISIETYDGNAGGTGSFQTKVALFDQSGEGWPDVVFSTQTNDASWAAKENNGVQAFAAPLNKGYFDDDFLGGFTEGALDPLTVDDTVYGLRNDLAPVVLWYNQPLLDKFGYDIPTTWEEYEQLGESLAAEHPGYILGSVGDSFAGPYVYYWGAQAPIFQLDGESFTSDFEDPKSVAMTDMLDGMIANGTLVQDSVFSATFVEKYADKIVAMPGPAWYSGALFQNPESLNAPAGAIGAADPLYWEGEDEVTGNVGGGTWFASSHSKNLDAVETFLEFVVASEDAVELASGLPAYDAAASEWIAAQASSGYFAGDFTAAIGKASTSVWTGWVSPASARRPRTPPSSFRRSPRARRSPTWFRHGESRSSMRPRSRATRFSKPRRQEIIITTTAHATAPVVGPLETEARRRGTRRRRSPDRSQARIGYAFSGGYTVLLLAFGIVPAVYAIYLAFTKNGAFVGVDNFVRVFGDYRFWPAVQHVALFVVVWLISLTLLVVLMALLVHAIRVRWASAAVRFLYYIPGALAGASSVMLWLFLLDPTVSPVAGLLSMFGLETFVQTVSLDNLPIIFTLIAFWTGAGGWMIIMYGALNNIPIDVMEAARIDGAGPVATAWHIQIPLMRKWISYMVVMSLAAGTQLFVEPRVLSQASKGVVPQDYSLNQLAYLFAFRQNDFNGSAAISLLLLVVAAGLSALFVFRGGLFERD